MIEPKSSEVLTTYCKVRTWVGPILLADYKVVRGLGDDMVVVVCLTEVLDAGVRILS